jgi:hypothetical protein
MTEYVFVVHRHTMYEYNYPNEMLKIFRKKKQAEDFVKDYDKQFRKGYYDYSIEKKLVSE